MAELVRDVQVLYADRQAAIDPEPFVQIVVSGRAARLIDRARAVADAIFPGGYSEEGGGIFISAMNWLPNDAKDGGWTLTIRFQPVGSPGDSLVWSKLRDA